MLHNVYMHRAEPSCSPNVSALHHPCLCADQLLSPSLQLAHHCMLHGPCRFLGYNALKDFFPTMDIKPNVACVNPRCVALQAEVCSCARCHTIPFHLQLHVMPAVCWHLRSLHKHVRH